MRVFSMAVWGVLLIAPGISAKEPIALARGGSGTICHCPCKTNSCDCTMHSETCHRCFGLTVNVEPMMLASILAAGDVPVLQASDAPWFETAPYPEVNVRLEAAMADSKGREGFDLRFVPDPGAAARYVPDKEFDAGAFASWGTRVDRAGAATLTVGAKDDPGTWQIVDGDLTHLNQSLEKSFRLVRRDGSTLEVFRSESTLAWELDLYLRAVVAGIPDEALLGESEPARSGLLSLVELVDLQMKAGDHAGVVRSLDALIDGAKARWLDPGSEETRGAICGFRKVRNLLVPGSRCA